MSDGVGVRGGMRVGGTWMRFFFLSDGFKVCAWLAWRWRGGVRN